jgi:hypothetical protein
MPVRHLLACLVIAATSVSAVTGCGGGDDPDTERRITAALESALAPTDPAELCAQTLSTQLVTKVYGSPERCVAVERAAAVGRQLPDRVEVANVVADGDRGTATVTVSGGSQDGVRGELSVVREDDTWRLDDLSTAFLRASFDAQLAGGGGGVEGALTTCVSKKVVGLDDAGLRELAFGAMGGRPEAQERLRGLAAECAAALGAPVTGESA